jgi:hypothetical protein
MAKKRKAAKKPPRLKAPSIVPETMPEPCAICAEPMKLISVIPKVDLSGQYLPVFPELRTFQCVACGNLRTVEQGHGAGNRSVPVAA